MRNKFLTKILGATLGLAMAIGVGVGVANYNNKTAKEAYAAENEVHDLIDLSGLTTDTWETSVSAYNATAWVSNGGQFAYAANYSKGWSYVRLCPGKKSNGVKNAYIATTNATTVRSKSVSYHCTKFKSGAVVIDHVTLSVWSTYTAGTKTYSNQVGTDIDCLSDYTTTNGSTARANNASFTMTIDAPSGVWAAGVYFKLEIGLNTENTNSNNGTDIDKVSITEGPQEGVEVYTVSFDSKGGSSVNTQNIPVSVDAKATEPNPAPTKEGYDFAGWYENEGLTGDPYNFNTVLTGNKTLYAKWTEKALTANYSSYGTYALTNGQGYHISGEVTAKCSSKSFFIQDGNSAMQIYDDSTTVSSAVSVGNTVDVYGTYQEGNNPEIKNIVYHHITSNDTENSQTPLTSLDDATEANRFKYFEIAQVQLNSTFGNNNQASLKGSSVVLYYANADYVNVGSSFNKNNYAANDYVSIKGVVEKYNSTIELKITYISKLAQYTILFESNGGSSVASQSVLEGNNVQEPANPTRASDELYNYTFAGWYTNPELTGNAYNFNTPVNSAFTLYAKWNRSDRAAKDVVANLNTKSSLTYHYSKEGNGAADTLNKAFTGISGSAYTDWSDKTGQSGVVYAGNSYGNSSAIQLNTGTTYYQGIVTTGNPNSHNVKKITIDWASNTTVSRYVEIYGKNEAYSSTEDLYDNETKGTLVTSLTCNENRDDSEYTFVADYKYIGIKASGALYIDSIDIQWGVLPTYTYSNVAIKFGGQISSSLWNRLDSESHGILGYGVMLATAEYLSGLSIKNYYDLARDEVADVDSVFDEVADKDYTLVDGLNIKCFYNEVSKMPRLVNGNYVWDLVKGVNGTNAGLTKPLTSVAFIRTTDDEIIFLQETTKSAAQVAKDIMDADPNDEYNDSYLEGSLANLASKAN